MFKVPKSEIELVKKIALNEDVTFIEAHRHLYYYIRFATARALTNHFDKKCELFHKKLTQDFHAYNFRSEMKKL